MRGDLSVRLNDGATDRHVTARTSDLRFTKTAPGGHAFGSCEIRASRDMFRDLGPTGKIWVYDKRTGKTVMEGYTENPGSADGSNGERLHLSFMGGGALASDQSEKLIYIDRSLDSWAQDTIESVNMPPSAKAEKAADPTIAERDVLLCQLLPGSPITTGHRAAVSYLGFRGTGMEVGALGYTQRAGKVDANYAVEGYLGTYPTFNQLPSSISAATTETNVTLYVVDNFASGKDIVGLRLRRSAGGATNVADETTYAVFSNPRVLGRRVNKYGAAVSGASGMIQHGYVLAGWVAEDLLGRLLLNVCDPAASSIGATTFPIDQLTFHDGATAADVLEHLSLYEPDMLWEILHSTSTGHVFNYRAWPTTPRYEISTKDGYSAPGGEDDLCNRISVFWTDKYGRKRQTPVTATVAALGSRIRDAEPVELPVGLGSTANAQRIGEQVLAAKNQPPKAAKAVVSRPIMDHLKGCMVMPWEIEPGYLVRVRETGDSLRLTEMEYVDNDGAATLTLGEPTLTIEQRIARLSRR